MMQYSKDDGCRAYWMLHSPTMPRCRTTLMAVSRSMWYSSLDNVWLGATTMESPEEEKVRFCCWWCRVRKDRIKDRIHSTQQQKPVSHLDLKHLTANIPPKASTCFVFICAVLLENNSYIASFTTSCRSYCTVPKISDKYLHNKIILHLAFAYCYTGKTQGWECITF